MAPRTAAPAAQQQHQGRSAVQPLVAGFCLLLLLAPLTLIITGAPSTQQPQQPWNQPLQGLRDRIWQGSRAISSFAADGEAARSRVVLHPNGEYAVAVPDEPPGSVPVQEFSSARSSAPLQKAYEVVSSPVADFSGRAMAAFKVLPSQVKQLAFPDRAELSARMTYQQWQHKMLDYFLHCSRQISMALSWSWQRGTAGAQYAQKTATSMSHAGGGLMRQAQHGLTVLKDHPDRVRLIRSSARSSAQGMARGTAQAWQGCNMFVKRQHARVSRIAADFWDLVRPGGQLHPQDFIDNHGDVVVQLVLALIVFYLLFQGKKQPRGPRREAPLTEKEIDQLCEDWQPEHLIRARPPSQQACEPPVIDRVEKLQVRVQGMHNPVLNMASNNFLALALDPEIQAACRSCIAKYGVGSCGPRGFFGTIDVHLELEAALAKFMGTEECIMYSYDMATINSVLPAFANAKDVIICDEQVNFAIQNGCKLSRATVHRFKHNDVADLERVLQQVDKQHRAARKPLNRRYIVVEGLYQGTGDLAPLAQIAALKRRYKYRLVVDESLAVGTLGPTGRGAAQHCGLQPQDVDIVCSSLGNALAAQGGFCAGPREMVDHQRLSGMGYCFSASLPPYLAVAASQALQALANKPQLVRRLQLNAASLRDALQDVPGLELMPSGEVSVPVLLFRVHPSLHKDQVADEELLQSIADRALTHGALFVVMRSTYLDTATRPPLLKVTVNAALSQQHLQQAAQALRQAAEDVCRPPKAPSQASGLDRSSSMSPKRYGADLVRKSMQMVGQGGEQAS